MTSSCMDTTRISRSGLNAMRSLMNSKPPRPGMVISVRMRSGLVRASSRPAAAGSPASPQTTRSACWFMSCARPARISGWSSTSRIRLRGSALESLAPVLPGLPVLLGDVIGRSRRGSIPGRGLRAGRSLPVGRRKHHQADEQAEPADGLGELVVVDGLLDVDVAAQLVAPFDLPRVVGRRQDDDRHLAQLRVRLQPPQHLRSLHLRHPDVEQDQVHLPVAVLLARARVEEEVKDRLPVGEMLYGVVEPSRDEVLPHKDGVAFIVVDNQDDRGALHGLAPGVWETAGSETKKVEPHPSRLSTQIFPPSRSSTRWAIVRPRPSPAWVSGLSRWKISNTLRRCSCA